MVVWNTAEAEFDEKLGEIVVKSRHRIENGQILPFKTTGSKIKPPKIVGAVSILLIQPGLTTEEEPTPLNPDEKDQTTTTKTESSSDTASELKKVIADNINVCIPASLSILPLPGITDIYDKYEKIKRKNSSIEVEESIIETGGPCPIENEMSLSKQNEGTCTFEHISDKNDSVPMDTESVQTVEEMKSKTDNCGSVNEHGSSSNSSFQEFEKNPDVSDEAVQEKQNNHSWPSEHDHHQVSTSNHGNDFTNLKTINTQNKDHRCLFCDEEVLTFESIVQHALENHGTPDDIDTISCPLCVETFTKRNMHDFLQHIRVHLKTKQREDNVEDVKSNTTVIDFSNVDLDKISSMDNLSSSEAQFLHFDQTDKHLSAEQQENSSKDYENSDILAVKQQRSSIMKPNSEGKLFCSKCGDALKGYRDIISHNKSHGNDNQCPICQKHFSMRGSLLRHCFSHTQNRVFSCHICGAIFTRKDNLKRHIQKHEMYGPVIRKTKSAFSNQTMIKVKEKNKVFKTTMSFPKMERLTSFKRQKPHYRKITPQIFKANRLQKTIIESQRNFKGQEHKLIDCDTYIENTDVFSGQKTGHDGNSEKDRIDEQVSTFQMSGNVSQYPGNPTAVSELPDTDDTPDSKESDNQYPILNYSCNMCGINFMKLSSLKRHVVMTHSEQSFDSTRAEYSDNITPSEMSVSQSKAPHSNLNAGYYQPPYFHKGDTDCFNLDNSSGNVGHYEIDDSESKTKSQTKLSFEGRIKIEPGEHDVIDIESLSQLPQFTPESQEKESKDYDEEQTTISGMFSSKEYLPVSDAHLNAAIQDSFSAYQSQPFSSSSYSQDIDLTKTSTLIKIPTVQVRSNQNRRHRMLNNKLPICHFCGMYLETGAQIVKHGDEHQDQFNHPCTCTICLQVLCGRDSLHRHAHSHIGTSFDCEFCSASFSRKDNLKRHLKKVHSVDTPSARNLTPSPKT